MPSGDEPITTDQEILDEIFDRVVQRLEEGLPVDVDMLAAEHAELRTPIERTVRLALQVAVGHSDALPVVPGFVVLKELGHGGMGAVYLAQQERLGGRAVALKLLPPSVALSPQARARFRAEALAIARLRHPHIVAVYDVVEDAGIYAFAMEWVDGRSLAALVDQALAGADPPSAADLRACFASRDNAPQCSYTEFVCGVGIAIADALAAVHREGLLHRDVKPSNVLVRNDGTALLSDFGLARAAGGSSLTLTDCFVGTPAFAAPEQLRGDNDQLDARTDIYGLGATLYYALTGTPPVRGTNPLQVLHQIESGAFKSLRCARSAVPADLATIVHKALAPDPGRRYKSADEFAADLRAFLAGEVIHAKPASLLYVMCKRIRRHRASVTLALVLTLTLCGWCAFSLHSWWRAYQGQFRVIVRSPGVQTVDVAVFDQNVPTTLPAGTLLQVNTLRGVSRNSEIPGGLGIGHSQGRHAGDVRLGAAQHLLVHGELQVGCGADGTLTVADGGAVECVCATLGPNLGARGELRVASTGASFKARDTLDVGVRGVGTLRVGPQAQVITEQVHAGQYADGMIVVSGQGAKLDAVRLEIAGHTVGRLEVSGGGTLSCREANLAVARSARAEVLVTGRGSCWATTTELRAGVGGVTDVVVTEGGLIRGHNFFLGNDSGSKGTLTIDGVDSAVRLDRKLYVGVNGAGHVDVRSGEIATDALLVSGAPGGTGSIRIAGERPRLTITTGCEIGAKGYGICECTDGSQIESTWIWLGRHVNGEGFVTLSGPGTTWLNRASCALGGYFRERGGVGGIRIEQGTKFLVELELVVWPKSKLSLAGGTLVAELLTLHDPAALEATAGLLAVRTVHGNLHITGATLASACAPGEINVLGDLTLENGALRVFLSGNEVGQFDRTHVSGATTLGGNLEVWAARDFRPGYDDRIPILLSAGSITGAFANASPVLRLRNGGTCEVYCADNELFLTHFKGPFASALIPDLSDACLLPAWTPPASGPFPGHISRNESNGLDRIFLGPPDDITFGVANGLVVFDFGARRVLDGPGPDFNVYEADTADIEFQKIRVSVSADGAEFLSVTESEAPMVRLPGDEAHDSDDFGRSYDLAVTGLSRVRFIRVEGLPATGAPYQSLGFDLDAIGAIHISEPASETSD